MPVNPATLSGNSGPAFDFNFLGSTVDPRLTFTRASAGWYFDAAGTLQSASTNIPRFDYGSSPGGVTNWIRNNSMVGAAASTTLPTLWGSTDGLPAATNGLTTTVVGTGIETDIPYIDMRVQGTSTLASTIFVRLDSNTQIIASNSQTWTMSAYMRLMSGSLANLTAHGLFIGERASNGSSLVVSQSIGGVTGAALSTQRLTLTRTNNNASTAFELPAVYFTYPISTVIDFVIRIGAPQLEQSASAGSLVLTTSAAVTANASLLGLLMEGARTNSLRNNSNTGAAVGTPGTLPTNWTQNNSTGLTANVIAFGTDSGLPYIDVQVSGTTATGQGNNIIMESVSQIAALNAQVWTGSIYTKLVAGALTNITSLALTTQVLDSGGASLGGLATTFTPTTASMASQRVSNVQTLNNASVAFVRQYVAITSNAAPVAVNLTFRIGAAQLELASFASSPILTTTAAVTRAADKCLMTWIPSTAYTLWCEAIPNFAISAIQCLVQVSGSAATIRSLLGINGTQLCMFDTVTNAIVNVGLITVSTLFRGAIAFSSIIRTGSLNGATVVQSTTAASTLPAGMNQFDIGSSGTSIQPFFGCIRKARLWTRALSKAELQATTR